MKNKSESCVEFNVYVECQKCSRVETDPICNLNEKKHDDEPCVKVNVFVDCDK